MTDRVGQKFGNYRLTRLLGEGGFAQVYLGEHLHLATLVAVKLLHTKFVTREQEEFLREARTIASLEHPSIVRVLDCGIEAGQNEPFIIMQYAPHGTLRQRHPKGARLSPPTIMEYVQQVASALQYAHDSKLIHRDVKPENMLLGAKDELLLSDFGIALISSSSSSQSTKAAAGTVAYMAPEQIVGKPRTASDQYALGIVVYEWLSGTAPFRGSFAEMCAQHLYAPPPSLCERLPWLDPGVEHVVMKALAKEPQDRFPTVTDFAIALGQCLWYQNSLPPGVNIDHISARVEKDKLSGSFPTDVIAANNASDNLPAASLDLESTTNKLSTDTTDTPIPVSMEGQATLLTATKSVFPRTNPSIPLTDDESTFVKGGAKPVPDLLTQTPNNIAFVNHQRRFGNRFQIVLLLIIVVLLLLLPVAYFTFARSLTSHAQNNIPTTGIPLTPQATYTSSSASAQQPTATSTSISTAIPTSPPTVPVTPQPVQRQLSAVQTASQTVNTTGQGATQATQATGILTFSNATSGTRLFTFASGSTFMNDEKTHITMMIDEAVTLPPGATKNVRAHVVETGTIGNIAPFANTGSGFYCCQEVPFAIVNNAPFTGGSDQSTYAAVQQSDITNAATPLISSTTSQAQADIQNQLQPNEHLLGPAQCRSKTTANHAAGDRASTVIVTVTTTCTATAST